MTTDYDPIAEQYKRSKQQAWRTYVECFTLMQLVGDPRGRAVLDVACGEGFYTRMIQQRGAARVTGVDLSQGMIDLARSQEAQHQLGIEYDLNVAIHEAAFHQAGFREVRWQTPRLSSEGLVHGKRALWVSVVN